MCCGQKMQEIVPGAVDASLEKHVPVVKIDGTLVTVSIGTNAHPMEEAHSIEWIALETKEGNQKMFGAGAGRQPRLPFARRWVIAAYAYCNLHGLWKGPQD